MSTSKYGFTPEKRYAEWLVDKDNLGLDFPNLPYYIEGDLKLTQVRNTSWLIGSSKSICLLTIEQHLPCSSSHTQSIAILRHVARKHNLAGENENQQARLEMFEQQAIDLRMALATICYNVENFEELKPGFIASIPNLLKPWSAVIGENKYLAGDRLTYTDFLLFDVLDYYRLFEPTALANFFNLVQYVERIEKLPTIAAYFSSGKYHKTP